MVWQARSDKVGAQHYPESDLPCQTTHALGFPFIPQHSTSYNTNCLPVTKILPKTFRKASNVKLSGMAQAYQTGQTRRFRDWYGSFWGIITCRILNDAIVHTDLNETSCWHRRRHCSLCSHFVNVHSLCVVCYKIGCHLLENRTIM